MALHGLHPGDPRVVVQHSLGLARTGPGLLTHRHPGMLTVAPPPLRHPPLPRHQIPGLPPGHPGLPQNIYVEDHMDHLAGKLDLLENELRYAWRALDVLSQEYIKMWERMEKLEGLLTEQQTVITQLIDLYTADSSDNAENEFEGSSNGR